MGAFRLYIPAQCTCEVYIASFAHLRLIRDARVRGTVGLAGAASAEVERLGRRVSDRPLAHVAAERHQRRGSRSRSFRGRLGKRNRSALPSHARMMLRVRLVLRRLCRPKRCAWRRRRRRCPARKAETVHLCDNRIARCACSERFRDLACGLPLQPKLLERPHAIFCPITHTKVLQGPYARLGRVYPYPATPPTRSRF